MKITFYKTSNDPRTVNKSFNLVYSTECELKEQTGLLHPTIIIAYNKNVWTCNYCYIEELQRYYFVGEPVMGYNQTLTIPLNVDVLMSWKTYLLNLYCVVERQEFNYNPYIFDGELLTRCDKTIITQNIGQVGVDNTIRYYLTTTGGVTESEVINET